MSNVEVDIINSITGGTIVVGPKFNVKDSTDTFEYFSAATSGVVISGLIYAGTEHDNSPGVSGQVLFGNGFTGAVSWEFAPVPKNYPIPTGTIVPWVVAHNGFCPSGSLPSLPQLGNTPDWRYCDGRNGAPDLRILDPQSTTGGRNFPPFSSSDIVVTLEVTGQTSEIANLYRFNNLERMFFYGTSISGDGGQGAAYAGPTAGLVLGPTTCSTIGVLLTITGPTVVGSSGRSTGVPTHQKAIIRIGGATGSTAALWRINAQGTPDPAGLTTSVIGEFYKGTPTDFVVGGFINFKTGTGPVMRINNVIQTEYIQPSTIQTWSNRCRYKNSIAYIQRL